ncbi:hypothetical protein AAKU61_004154, partial [Undibacterium sp. GrIS 1.2]
PALLNHTFERKSIKITKSARYLGFMEGLQLITEQKQKEDERPSGSIHINALILLPSPR